MVAVRAVGPSDRRTIGPPLRRARAFQRARSAGPPLRLSAWLLLSVGPTVRLAAQQCPDGSPPPCRGAPARTAPAPRPNSVAVLYFDNLSPDTADAYLADGLAEAVSLRLGHAERLVIKSPAALRRFRGRNADMDPAALGRALGVAHLVQGSVRRRAGRLLVTVTLTRAENGVQEWGERYDRVETDLLAVEEDIGQKVAEAVAGRLLPADRASLSRRPTISPVAYDHYLRGNFLIAQRTTRTARMAVDEYEAAVRIDPAFADAWARLAFGAGLFADWNLEWPGLSRDSVLARGLAAEARARALDPLSANAWLARGYLLRWTGAPTAAAEAALERAVELGPRNAEAWHYYGLALFEAGHDSSARAAFERGVAIDPTRAIGLAAFAWLEFDLRRDTAALRWADSALTVDPMFAHGYEHRAQINAHLGRHAAARADAEEAIRLGQRPASVAMLAMVQALAGDTLAARLLLATIDPVAGADQHLWTIAALVVAGEHERALDALGHLPLHKPQLLAALRSRDFDPIRGDARFQRLVAEATPK